MNIYHFENVYNENLTISIKALNYEEATNLLQNEVQRIMDYKRAKLIMTQNNEKKKV